MRMERKYTDKELLDFLQELTNKDEYTGSVILRKSEHGRGWRLHETARYGSVPDVRQAIINYIEQSSKPKQEEE
jgi:hypothetical protein